MKNVFSILLTLLMSALLLPLLLYCHIHEISRYQDFNMYVNMVIYCEIWFLIYITISNINTNSSRYTLTSYIHYTCYIYIYIYIYIFD